MSRVHRDLSFFAFVMCSGLLWVWVRLGSLASWSVSGALFWVLFRMCIVCACFFCFGVFGGNCIGGVLLRSGLCLAAVCC